MKETAVSKPWPERNNGTTPVTRGGHVPTGVGADRRVKAAARLTKNPNKRARAFWLQPVESSSATDTWMPGWRTSR